MFRSVSEFRQYLPNKSYALKKGSVPGVLKIKLLNRTVKKYQFIVGNILITIKRIF